MIVTRFEVGDRVVVAKDNACNAPVTAGESGAVVRVDFEDDDDPDFAVRMDRDGAMWLFGGDDLVLERVAAQ